MPTKDLRAWIAELERAGEVKAIKGANTTEEIGGIVDIYMRRWASPRCCSMRSPATPRAIACSPTS